MKFKKEVYKIIYLNIEKLIKEGKTAKEICTSLQISKSTLFRTLNKLDLQIPNYHNSLKFDNTVFDIIDTEEKAYWLGFLYADGNVGNTNNIVSLTLQYSDINHLEKFNAFIKNKKSVQKNAIKVKNKEYQICKVSVCNKYFKESLIRLGCIPKKSLVLKFPDLNIFTDKKLIYDFIRGYVDGDGCLTFSKTGRLELSILGTKEFLSKIIDIFPNRFKSLHKIKRLTTNVYKISNCGDNADYVTSILYKNATVYLERKYNRFAVLNRNI